MKFLLVEEDRDLVLSLKRFLLSKSIELDCAYDGVQAINILEQSKYDCLIIDTKLSRISGPEVIENVLSKDAFIPILTITNKPNFDENLLKLKINISDYLNKPFFINDFSFVIDSIIKNINESDFYINDIQISPSKFKMTNLNSNAYLTSREIDCLRLLKNQSSNYITMNDLSLILSKEEIIFDTGIYIRSINSKFKDINANIHIGDFINKGYKVVKNHD